MKNYLHRLIAFRYLVSKKSYSVINMISIVSVAAIAVPTAAMVILISVHNGFQNFIETLWSSLSPELVVTPTAGKYFEASDVDSSRLISVRGVKDATYYIEDNALVKYKGRQIISRVRGVDDRYDEVTPIGNIVVQGRYGVSGRQSVIGMGVAVSLGIQTNLSKGVSLYYPSKRRFSPLNFGSNYSSIDVDPGGVFTLDVSSDADLIFISLSQAEQLFDKRGEVTTVGISLEPDSDIKDIKSRLSDILGAGFVVKDRYEQNESEHRLIKNEKFSIYLIIFLVVIIALFTLIGAIVMLITEKKSSIESLEIIGVTRNDTKMIFFWLGTYLSILGATIGVVIGLIVSLSQQFFGLVKLNSQIALIDAYPIFVDWFDILTIFVSVSLLSVSMVWVITKMRINNV